MRFLLNYRLPNGEVVRVDASASKGATYSTFTMRDRRIVLMGLIHDAEYDRWMALPAWERA